MRSVIELPTELCLPGLKALVRIAQDSQVDLETIDLKPVEKIMLQKDLAKLSFQLKKGAQVQELITMVKEGEFPALKASQHQASIIEVANRLEKATVSEVLIQEISLHTEKSMGAKSIIKSIERGQETLEEVIMDISKEFGPKSAPVREVAAVGQLLNEGIRCDEVVTMMDAGLLPALQNPEAQLPLVSIVTQKGHTSVVCEVLVEESAKELQKAMPSPTAARISEYKEMLAKAKSTSANILSKCRC